MPTLDWLGRNLREVLDLAHDLSEKQVGVLTCRPLPINTAGEGMGRIVFLLLALFAEMERTSPLNAPPTPEPWPNCRPPHRPPRRPSRRHDRVRPASETTGGNLGEIAAKTGIP